MSPRGASQTGLELSPQAELPLVHSVATTLACRTLPHADSAKLLVIPDGSPDPALRPDPDVVTGELLPTVDDPTIPPDPAVVPTPEKTAGSKRRPLTQKTEGQAKKKRGV